MKYRLPFLVYSNLESMNKNDDLDLKFTKDQEFLNKFGLSCLHNMLLLSKGIRKEMVKNGFITFMEQELSLIST